MAKWFRADSVVLILLLVALGCGHESDNDYCERLNEMKQMPFTREDTVEDEVYNGLRSQGKEVVACLLGKVTDIHPMADPRQAPPHPGFAVGDAAVMVLADICDMSIEEALPEDFRPKWRDQGIYAYFEFVGAGLENRQQVADALKKQGCN